MVAIEKIEYHGWPNCIKISNALINLIVTTDVGPRIMHFGFKDGENQLYENPTDAGVMGGDKWHNFGGHRLWHAPEDFVRTYAPDNQPVQVKQLKDGVKLTSAVEPNGVQKVVEIHLADAEPKVKVNHTLINHNLWTIPLAVWCLTVMKAGGKVIVPHSARIGHDDQLTPNESFALWGYTKMDDPRWTWCEKYFFLKQDSSSKTCQKIGSLNTNGWAACYRKGDLFVKKFDYNPALTYPDFNCNFETYTDANILEIETLGPMVQLEPGKKTEHLEEWSLFKGIKDISTDADVDRYVIPLL
jgi:hypothetical protein